MPNRRQERRRRRMRRTAGRYNGYNNFAGRYDKYSEEMENLRRKLAEMMKQYGFDSDTEEEVPPPKEKKVLKIEKVDFLVEDNTKKHKTDEYDITSEKQQLVVRRGQEFKIKITFNREFKAKEDDLKLLFSFGKDPLESKGTLVDIVLSDKDAEGKWGAKIESSDGAISSTVTVFTPPSCLIGKWKFMIDVIMKDKEEESIYRYKHRHPVYILFNPWCKGDQTFFPDKSETGPDNELLDEYVRNESGKIYTGSKRQISSRPWNFGQFEGNVLDCAMMLLDEMSPTARGDVIKVVRHLTAIVNSSDDDGVLAGNWSGDYSGGVSPTTWNGSVAILEKFYETNETVNYGQCWVFSGLLTTVLRTLGIPSRSVTNFASAHDSDGSVTIDIHFSEAGDVLDHLNRDSVWNFHVWNEAYMCRPDLPAGYGGWQACDSTPQEESSGIYCCGPASVRAIKHGEVQHAHDAPFVFAEVNADKIYWNQLPNGRLQKINVVGEAIGKYISTKKPGKTISNVFRNRFGKTDPDRDDVTLNYKYEDGSAEERAAVLRANQVASTKVNVYGNPRRFDVEFEMVDYDDVCYGKPFFIHLKMKNVSEMSRNVSGKLSAASVFYTGVHANMIKFEHFSVDIGGKESKEIKLPVSYDDYAENVVQHCMIKLSVMCKVGETEQVHTDQSDFRLRKPHLTVKAPSETTLGQKVNFVISFTNPLPTTLTNCLLVVEGPGLQKPLTLDQPNVSPLSTFTANFEMAPKKPGQRNLILNFTSKELEGITGVHGILVRK